MLAPARHATPGGLVMRLALLSLVLLAFSALTVHATLAHGYLGVFEATRS